MRVSTGYFHPVVLALALLTLAAPARTGCCAGSGTVNLTSQGNGLYVQADYAGAVTLYDAALAIEQYDVALNNKGLALIRLARPGEAIGVIRQAIQLNPSEKRYYLNIGKACAHADQLTSAVAYFNAALAIDPAYKEAYFNRGWCWDALGQNTAAIDDYQRALAVDASYTAPKIGIGVVWARRGNAPTATWWLLRAISTSTSGGSGALVNQLAHRDLRIVRGDEAVFAQAASVDRLTSGIRCLERQQYATAIDAFARVAADESSASLAIDYLGRALTLANASASRINAQIQYLDGVLPAVLLDSVPGGATASLDYRSEGATSKTLHLFPGKYYYFAKSGARIALGDCRAAATPSTFKLDLNTSPSADLNKLVTGSAFGSIPNALQIGATQSIDLRALMHAAAARYNGVCTADDFKDSGILVEPLSGYFSDTESICTATLTCTASFIDIKTKAAAFGGSKPAFRFVAGASLESHPEPIVFQVAWVSEFTTGSLRISVDPDCDDDLLIDTLEAQHGCDPFKPDFDGDGQPDGWEIYHGLDPHDPDDSDADKDGDGVPNFGEWLIDSDPRDPASPANVYVDCNAGGDDTGDGSMARPYGTIAKAIAAGGAPLAIRIGKGTYTERLTLRDRQALIGSGSDCGTTITAAGQGRPISLPDNVSAVIKDLKITGGAIPAHEYGGGICCSKKPRLYLNRVTVAGNCTYSIYYACGGGVAISGGLLRVVQCVIRDNWTHGDGGGIFAYETNVTLLNSLIAGNDAYSYGDGVDVSYGSFYARNTDFVKNGGEGLKFFMVVPVITNCIFWGNDFGNRGRDIASGNLNFSYVLANNCVQCGNENGNSGNFMSDPKFADFAGNDFHLAAGSPCIDSGIAQGSMLTDLEDMPIPQGAGVERGCYEYNPGLRRHLRVVRYLLGLESDPAGLDANDDKKVDIADAIKNLNNQLPGMPMPQGPADGAKDVSLYPTFTWKSARYAASYDLFLWDASATTATTPIASAVAGTSWTKPTPALNYATLYKWRVAARNAGASTLGPIFKFTTHSQRVQVLTPNDSEASWTRGTTAYIRYFANIAEAGTDYRIDLWMGGSKVASLKAVSSNTSGYKGEFVTVPATLLLGTNYKVQVTSIQMEKAGAGIDAYDFSDQPFTIK